MRNQLHRIPLGLFFIFCSLVFLQQCNTPAPMKELTNEQKIARGKYLVTIGSCNDCHSPKIFTQMGPAPDTTRLLSGHPADGPVPKIDTSALNPRQWIMFSPDLTMFVGPWGISYSANLTPDSATGLGAWSEETFMKTLRTGHHLGLPGGRMIQPPMPWMFVGQMTDEDLKSVYAFLRSLPPVKNQVPVPVPPSEVAKM